MENYSVEQFKRDVIEEAKALRHNAEPEELAKLNMELLDPGDETACIYGQMTGSCRSLRASDLIFACCKRYIGPSFKESDIESLLTHAKGSTIYGVVDGETLLKRRGSGFFTISHFSAIEAYIMIKGAKIDNLIAYLKGDTDTLEL